MAIITKIEEQKNKKRVNIFVDNAFFCGLNKETVLVFRLRVGDSIEDNRLKKALFESEVKSAFEKAVDYLEVRMQSKREIYDKLLKKSFSKEVINSAIFRLEEYNYVNDEAFAKLYIEQNKKYSKKMLENKLKQKGVSAEIINNVLEIRKDDDEIDLCKKMIEKYVRNKDLSTEGAKQKMYASLSRKGFTFDIIKRSSKCVLNEIDDDFNFSD